VSGKGGLGALVMATGGGILLWTGLTSSTGNPRDTLGALLAGKKPGTPGTAPAAGIFGPGATVPVGFGASATGSAIASDALRYQGHLYCFGGSQMASTNGCPVGQWDCSSFVNWVIGHDLGMAIPGYAGGTYNGTSHGPSSFVWAAWTGCTTVGHSASAAVAGDILIWMGGAGHIGIALGGGQMISALGPNGTPSTMVTGITGTASGIFLVRRLNATGITMGRKK